MGLLVWLIRAAVITRVSIRWLATRFREVLVLFGFPSPIELRWVAEELRLCTDRPVIGGPVFVIYGALDIPTILAKLTAG